MVLLHTFQCAGHSVDLSGQFPQLGAVLEGVVEVLHKFFPRPLLWLLFGCGWWEPVFGHIPILVVPTLGQGGQMVEEFFPGGLFKYGGVWDDEFLLEGVY